MQTPSTFATFTILLLLSLSISAPQALAHDCNTELGESMRALKDSMRAIGKAARQGDNVALEEEIDTTLLYVEEAKTQWPKTFAQLSGDALDSAKNEYSENLNQLETMLTELQTADATQAKKIVKGIKKLQKKSHKAFKDC